MGNKVCVPIDADIYAEFILRTGKCLDVASFMENIISDYLDRTDGDADIWSAEHVEKVQAELDDDFEEIYGRPDCYYQWDEVILWNSTKIRMKYKGKSYFAVVKNEEIVFEEMVYSPSQLAAKIANGTNRNAWRDLWIKEHGSSKWVLADDLRREARNRPMISLEDF